MTQLGRSHVPEERRLPTAAQDAILPTDSEDCLPHRFQNVSFKAPWNSRDRPAWLVTVPNAELVTVVLGSLKFG